MKSKLFLKTMILIPMVFVASCGTNPQPEPEPEPHVHMLTTIDAKNPTCLVDGNIKYYMCTECKKLFSDEGCSKEITLADTVKTKLGHSPTSSYELDNDKHWHTCNNIGCNEHLNIGNHEFDDPVKIEGKWMLTCKVCGYQKEGEAPTGAVKGLISLPLGSTLDLTKVQLEFLSADADIVIKDAVGNDGAFNVNVPVGENYNVIATYPAGYRAVATETINVSKATPVTGVNMILSKGNMVGPCYVNDTLIRPVANYSMANINDILDNDIIDDGFTSNYKRTNWEGARSIYAVPVNTEIRSGDFSFIGNVSAGGPGAYGYTGIGITDGTYILTLETSYMEPGFSFIKFGKYDDYHTYVKDGSFPFEDGIKAGGIANQTAGGLNATFTIRKEGESFIFSVGDVRMAHLNTNEGLIVEDNWQQTYSPNFLKRIYGEELASFLASGNEYALVYTSWGIAGISKYASSHANYNTVRGKITVPNGYDVTNTRIQLSNDLIDKTYYDVIDEEGNYSIDVPASIYNINFTHPEGLYGQLANVDTVNHPTANNITLEEGFVSKKQFAINGATVNLGMNVELDNPVDSATGYVRSVDTNGEKGGSNHEFVMFPNSISNKSTKYSMAFNGNGTYGYIGSVLTDGNSIIRVNMANFWTNQIEFEYMLITPDGTGCWVSNFRSYRIQGSSLPTFYGGSTSGDVKVTFEKNSDGTIDIYIRDFKAITIKSTGFYLADGLSIPNKTLETGNRIPNPQGYFAGPEAAFVMKDREYAIGSCILGHENVSGGNATFKPSVKVNEIVEPGHEHDESLKSKLSGKYLSILGDSISTFEGVSNSTKNNDTIGVNQSNYPAYDVDKVEETYWNRLINDTDMELLVNNSWGGTRVTDANTLSRAENLHANTGSLSGTNPDIIILYMGINDVGHSTMDANTFKTAYDDLVNTIKTKYSSADLWIMDLPHPNPTSHARQKVDQFNAAISEVVTKYGLASRFIHLSGSVMDDYSKYCSEYVESYKLHPNYDGMRLMNNVIKEALYSYYCND